jgi:hypothetical protein
MKYEYDDDRQGNGARRETKGRDTASPFGFNQLDITAKPAKPSSGDVEAQRQQERAEDQVCHAGKLRLVSR